MRSVLLKSLMMVLMVSILTLPVTFFLFVNPAFAELQTDQQQIQAIVVRKLTHPRLPANVHPTMDKVVIVENYALAGWTSDPAGGEMLLIKQDGKWRVLTGGGGVMNADDLVEYGGVPRQIATQLIQKFGQ